MVKRDWYSFRTACEAIRKQLTGEQRLHLLYLLREKEMTLKEIQAKLKCEPQAAKKLVERAQADGVVVFREKANAMGTRQLGSQRLYALNRRALRFFVRDTFVKELLNERREDHTTNEDDNDSDDVRQKTGKGDLSELWGGGVGTTR